MQGGIDNLKWNEERRGILSSQRLSDKGTILQPKLPLKITIFPPTRAVSTPKKRSRSQKKRPNLFKVKEKSYFCAA